MNDWNVKSSEAQIKAEADMRLANVEDYLPFQSQPKAWRKRKVMVLTHGIHGCYWQHRRHWKIHGHLPVRQTFAKVSKLHADMLQRQGFSIQGFRCSDPG
jgi:hypothetical protein